MDQANLSLQRRNESKEDADNTNLYMKEGCRTRRMKALLIMRASNEITNAFHLMYFSSTYKKC